MSVTWRVAAFRPQLLGGYLCLGLLIVQGGHGLQAKHVTVEGMGSRDAELLERVLLRMRVPCFVEVQNSAIVTFWGTASELDAVTDVLRDGYGVDLVRGARVRFIAPSRWSVLSLSSTPESYAEVMSQIDPLSLLGRALGFLGPLKSSPAIARIEYRVRPFLSGALKRTELIEGLVSFAGRTPPLSFSYTPAESAPVEFR